MATLNISPDMLAWTAERLGTTVPGLADDMASASRKEKFVRGMLTPAQAASLAAKAGIPFGYLFLAKPPDARQAEIPDLRQTVHSEPLGRSFFDLLDDIELKRAWFAQHLRENEIDGPPFVGRFANAKASPKEVAADIGKTIGITPGQRAKCKSHNDFYELLASRFEDAGVLVFRSGVAKGNPNQPLPVTQFRGFAIADSLTPVVFVNGRDSPAAWVFTLIHEAAHIWLGLTGVSDASVSSVRDSGGTEAFCNRVAAEVLTPEEEFVKRWKNDGTGSPIDALARHFVVSRLVIARRALDAGFIGRDAYNAVLAASAPKRDTAGGNPYATIPIRSSRRFTRTVLSSAMAGETMLREAGRLLNVRPGTVVQLHRKGAKLNEAEGTNE